MITHLSYRNEEELPCSSTFTYFSVPQKRNPQFIFLYQGSRTVFRHLLLRPVCCTAALPPSQRRTCMGRCHARRLMRSAAFGLHATVPCAPPLPTPAAGAMRSCRCHATHGYWRSFPPRAAAPPTPLLLRSVLPVPDATSPPPADHHALAASVLAVPGVGPHPLCCPTVASSHVCGMRAEPEQEAGERTHAV